MKHIRSPVYLRSFVADKGRKMIPSRLSQNSKDCKSSLVLPFLHCLLTLPVLPARNCRAWTSFLGRIHTSSCLQTMKAWAERRGRTGKRVTVELLMMGQILNLVQVKPIQMQDPYKNVPQAQDNLGEILLHDYSYLFKIDLWWLILFDWKWLSKSCSKRHCHGHQRSSLFPGHGFGGKLRHPDCPWKLAEIW